MTSDDAAEKRREYQRRWRENNEARKEHMKKYRQRRKATQLSADENDPSPIEEQLSTAGTLTPEAQAQDLAFRVAMSAAIAAGHEKAVTAISTTPDTKAPKSISVNLYRLTCR